MHLLYSFDQNSFHFDYSFGQQLHSHDWAIIAQLSRREAILFIELLEWKYGVEGGLRYPFIPMVKDEYVWFDLFYNKHQIK